MGNKPTQEELNRIRGEYEKYGKIQAIGLGELVPSGIDTKTGEIVYVESLFIYYETLFIKKKKIPTIFEGRVVLIEKVGRVKPA